MSGRPHITLAEQHIRPLQPGEVVHHKDGDHGNNAIDNLQIVTRAEHIRIHKPVLGYKFTDEQRRRLSEAHKGLPSPMKGKKGHPAWNKGMEGFQKGRVITWGAKITQAKTKVTKEKAIAALEEHPTATLKELMSILGIKSETPIHKLGGIKRLRKEVL